MSLSSLTSTSPCSPRLLLFLLMMSGCGGEGIRSFPDEEGQELAFNPIVYEDTYEGIHPFWTFDGSISDAAIRTSADHASFVWGALRTVAAYRASNNPKIVLSKYI